MIKLLSNLDHEANPDIEGPGIFLVPKQAKNALHLNPSTELVVLLQQEGSLKPVSDGSCGTCGESHRLMAVVELHIKVGTESLVMIDCVKTKQFSNLKENLTHRESIFLNHPQIKL